MKKVHFETSGPLGILTLENSPLNLLSGELIADLRATITEVQLSGPVTTRMSSGRD